MRPIARTTILLSVLVVVACSKRAQESALQSQVVGTWTFNPREQLSPDAIDDVAFETPDQLILEVTPARTEDNGGRRGTYVKYWHIPKLVHSEDHWVPASCLHPEATRAES